MAECEVGKADNGVCFKQQNVYIHSIICAGSREYSDGGTQKNKNMHWKCSWNGYILLLHFNIFFSEISICTFTVFTDISTHLQQKK